MKYTELTTRQRIKNLTEVINDSNDLGFSKFFIARLREQLTELIIQEKEEREAGRRILLVLHNKKEVVN